MSGSSMVILMAIFILSALVGIVMVGSKEIVVLRMISVIVLVVIVVSIFYTIIYGSKLSIVSKVRESEGYYVLLVIMLSIVVLDVNFGVWISLLVFGVLLRIFYGNSMITVL